MAKPIVPQESFADLSFPRAGIDLSMSFSRQPNRPSAGGEYARTCPVGINVRAFEPSTNRSRGGQRAGISKYVSARVNGSALIQELFPVVGTGFSSPGGNVQTSQSGRVVTLVAVSGGSVFVCNPGDTAWTAAVSGTNCLNTSGVVLSASNNQKLFFADGTHWKYYSPSDNTVHDWVATAGTRPTDASGNAPRLICTWRGRTVLSGLLKDPQNWFMTAVNDPTNWDYSPASITPTQAIAGNNSPLGLVGDVVTSLVPLTDDVLLVGCDHSIWRITGDPMSGGQIDMVSSTIGMAWGVPWCLDPYGTIYFVSNRMGVFSITPGQLPQRISQPVEQLLQQANTGTSTIRLIWDDRYQGLHIFITPTAAAAATTHFFWEQRSGAWWTDVFTNNDHSPLCCCVFDGNLPGDRAALIGSWDGYVRVVDPDALDDDGTPISSSVVIGPILSKDLDDMLLKDIQAVLGESSGDVTFSVLVGSSAESALSATTAVSGTWQAGRNLSNLIRRSGHAVYVRLTAVEPWAIEAIRVRIAGSGKVRRRGK